MGPDRNTDKVGVFHRLVAGKGGVAVASSPKMNAAMLCPHGRWLEFVVAKVASTGEMTHALNKKGKNGKIVAAALFHCRRAGEI
jgi:hypothetical protein